MRKGKQKRLPTPGTNRKAWISGALNWRTGRFHWLTGERKNDELFLKLLEKLRQILHCHSQPLLAADYDASHKSKRVKEYWRRAVSGCGCTRCPHGAGSPTDSGIIRPH
jgi:hypothetical protein